MRRLTVLLALALLPLALVACTGADGQKAQSLLDQARAAQQSVRTETFSLNATIDAAGKSMQFGASGASILKGAGAGDFYANMTTSVPGAAAPTTVVMVKRGKTFTMTLNGVAHNVPVPSSVKASAPTGFDLNALTPYVKDVSVSSLDVNGETDDEIVGTIDGDALLSNLGGLNAGLFKGLGVSLGDIKVTLLIPRNSHLVETALIDMTLHAAKQSMHMSLSYAVTGVNTPVTFPS